MARRHIVAEMDEKGFALDLKHKDLERSGKFKNQHIEEVPVKKEKVQKTVKISKDSDLEEIKEEDMENLKTEKIPETPVDDGKTSDSLSKSDVPPTKKPNPFAKKKS